MDHTKKKFEIENMILKKIEEDKNFEKLLFSNPHEALKSLGVTIPKEIKLKIMRQEKGELVLVLPHPSQGDDELTDLELRYSSGGAAQGTSAVTPQCTTTAC